MHIGTADGKGFSFSLGAAGWSVFLPAGKRSPSIAFGVSVRNLQGEFRPAVSLFVIGNRPYCRMWHLRPPFNIVRVGVWGCWR